MPNKRHEAAILRCTAKTKAGRSCSAPPLHGGKLCAFHANPSRAAELGRCGGYKNRHVPADVPESSTLPPNSASDVQVLLARAVADLRDRRLDPKTASSLAYVAQALIRSIEVADLERRLAKLESLSNECQDEA
jgi:hypothetical protein